MMEHRRSVARPYRPIAPIVLAVFLIAHHGAAAELAPESQVRLYKFSEVSPEFLRKAYAASRSIPAPLWERLHSAGWRVCVAEYVADAMPGLQNSQPRGWPAGATWEQSDAVHLPDRRLVVFGEKRRSKSGAPLPNSRLEGSLRHELGHAFDAASGGAEGLRSLTGEFQAAYFDDLRLVTSTQRERLAYYLQRGAAGRQETFAEAFAILLGGGSDNDKRELFMQCFPRTLDYVRRLMDDAATPVR